MCNVSEFLGFERVLMESGSPAHAGDARLVPATRRVALGRYVAAALGLGAVGAVGAAARGPGAARPTTATSLVIQDDMVDDAMAAACVDDDHAPFASKIQELGGFITAAYPGGAVILTDRGSYDVFHRGSYDVAAMRASMVDGYDAALAACNADVADCPGAFGDHPPDCGLDDEAHYAIGCTESCLQDRFVAVDGGAYAHCADPVSAAMFLTPDLFKSCLSGVGDCAACIDACLAEDPLVPYCHAPVDDDTVDPTISKKAPHENGAPGLKDQ